MNFQQIIDSDEGDKAFVEGLKKVTSDVEGLSEDTLEIIIHFIYLGCVDDDRLTDDNIMEILYGASMFLLDDLKRFCEKKFLHKCEQSDIVSLYFFNFCCWGT